MINLKFKDNYLTLQQFIFNPKNMIDQEQFLDELLKKAGFDPEEDDFETLKEDMRITLDEYVELNLYSQLDETQKQAYDDEQDFSIFQRNIPDFENVLEKIYTDWGNNYLESFNEDDEDEEEDEEGENEDHTED